MAGQIHVLLSCAMSVDGAIDDASSKRLMLSDAADLDRVDDLRATCDAVLVGAGTIRADDPRLLIRSETRRQQRLARGLPANPTKVTLTRRGRLDRRAQFFTAGDTEKLVYCLPAAVEEARRHVGDVATVITPSRVDRDDDADVEMLDPRDVVDDLSARGVRRLMVEGGSATNTAFLARGVVDELQLVIAPFFVGQLDAPRLVTAGDFPHDARNQMALAAVKPIGDQVLLRYVLDRDV